MASTYGDVSNSTNGRSTPDPAGLADQIAQLKLDSSPSVKPQTPSQASIKAGAGTTAPSSTTPSRGLSSSPVTVRLQVAAALTPPKATVLSDEKTSRERPHSYTGGLSTADLRKLQMGTFNNEPDPSASRGATPITARPMNQWPSFNSDDAPPVPSLSSSTSGRPGSSSSQPAPGFPLQEDVESEFSIQQQSFHPPQPQPLPAGAPRINQSPGLGSFPRGGAHGLGAPFNSQRSFSPAIQGGMPMQSPPPTFTGFAQQGMPLSMYDMMSAGAVDPSLARVQQQHGAGPNFRQGHGHNSNDLTVNVMPDARTLALMQSMQGGFNGPAMYSPPPGALGHQVPPPSAGALGMYANGGMGAGAARVPMYAQELYAQADGAFSAAAQMQQQYLANYNPAIPQPPAAALNQLAAASVNLQAAAVAAVAAANATAASAAGNATNSGPSANNRKLGLYKTELCRSWEEKGTCRYGTKCQFAHGEDELRQVQRHPKYKTEVCRTFWVSGSCPYGKRCCFLHTEGTDGSPPPNLSGHSRSRSASTNSDSAESNSLLHRISRAQGVVAAATTTSQVATPVDKPSTPTSAGYSRPGGLRLDTTSLGGVSALAKENKSAYPSFPQGPSALSQHTAPEPSSALSPLPMTAHPDFGGRHGSNLARLDVGAAAQARIGKAKAASPNNRHSFNGTDLGLDFSNVGPGSLATPVQTTGPSLGRSSGHMRSGSAGNWAALSRSSRLGNSPYSSIPSVDVNNNSPWTASNSELTSLT